MQILFSKSAETWKRTFFGPIDIEKNLAAHPHLNICRQGGGGYPPWISLDSPSKQNWATDSCTSYTVFDGPIVKRF
jgi:hypothetical protein